MNFSTPIKLSFTVKTVLAFLCMNLPCSGHSYSGQMKKLNLCNYYLIQRVVGSVNFSVVILTD